MTGAEAARARYHARKASGLCVRCGAGMLPEWETLNCPECRELILTQHRRNERKPSRRARHAEWIRAAYQRDPIAARAKQNAARMERKARGQCLSCVAPAADDSVFCPHHRDVHREKTREGARRRRAAARKEAA